MNLIPVFYRRSLSPTYSDCTVFTTVFPALLCPSDSGASQCDNQAKSTGTNYKSPFGTTINDTHAAFYFNRRVMLACIPDGTGSTIAFAEVLRDARRGKLPLERITVNRGINDAAADTLVAANASGYSKYKSMRRYRASLQGIAAAKGAWQ